MGGGFGEVTAVTIYAFGLQPHVGLGKYDYDNHSTKVPLDRRGRRSGLTLVDPIRARRGKRGSRSPGGI